MGSSSFTGAAGFEVIIQVNYLESVADKPKG